SVRKAISDISSFITTDIEHKEALSARSAAVELSKLGREKALSILSAMEEEMAEAAGSVDFEEAAKLRDRIVELRRELDSLSEEDVLGQLKDSARKGSSYGRKKRK